MPADVKSIQQLKCAHDHGLSAVAQRVVPEDVEVAALSIHHPAYKFLQLPPNDRWNKRNQKIQRGPVVIKRHDRRTCSKRNFKGDKEKLDEKRRGRISPVIIPLTRR